MRLTRTRTASISYLLFNYFQKKSKSHFVRFIFLKIMTFQHFTFINLMNFNNFFLVSRKIMNYKFRNNTKIFLKLKKKILKITRLMKIKC